MTPVSVEIAGGGSGGIGQPSAITVSASEIAGGGNGGMGQPSTVKVPGVTAELLAVWLTKHTTGSTINIASEEIAASKTVFFKGYPSCHAA